MLKIRNNLLETLLILFGIITIFIAAITVPIMDRDEARYAQSSKQMVEGGDYLNIRFHDQARNKKPAGAYWLQSLSINTFNINKEHKLFSIIIQRIPSLVFSIIILLLTYKIANLLFNKHIALNSVLILLTSIVFIIESFTAKTDIFMLASMTLSFYGICKINIGTNNKILALLYLWGGCLLGLYIKGPITLGIILTILFGQKIFNKQTTVLKKYKIYTGIIINGALFIPWLLLMNHVTNGQFLQDSLVNDFLSKVHTANEKHSAPIFTYLLSFIITFPLIVISSFAVIKNLKQIFIKHKQALTLLLLWIIPFWLIIEFSQTKLPHYILIFTPAMAIISSLLLSYLYNKKNQIIIVSLIFLTTILLFFIVNYYLLLNFTSFKNLNLVFALFFIITILVNLYFLNLAKKNIPLQLCINYSLCIFVTLILQTYWLKPLFITPQIQQAKNILNSTTKSTYALMGYYEPSAIYYLGTKTILINDNISYFKKIISQKDRITLITEKYFIDLICNTELKNSLYTYYKIYGYQYTKGKFTTLYFIGNRKNLIGKNIMETNSPCK